MQFEKVSNRDLNGRLELIERTLQKGRETGMEEDLEVRLISDKHKITMELIRRKKVCGKC